MGKTKKTLVMGSKNLTGMSDIREKNKPGRPPKRRISGDSPQNKKMRTDIVNENEKGWVTVDEEEMIAGEHEGITITEDDNEKLDEVDDDSLWGIEAKWEIAQIKAYTVDEDIHTLMDFFDIDSYQKEGGNEISSKISKYVNILNKVDEKGMESVTKAIKFLRKNNGLGNTIVTKNIDDMIKLFITEVDKRLPRNCEECGITYADKLTNTPIVKCFTCNIGHHGCNNIEIDLDKPGQIWVCKECRDLLIEDNVGSSIREEISKKSEEKKERINKKRKRDPNNSDTTSRKTKSVVKKAYYCKKCEKIIHSYMGSIGCTRCSDNWFHIRCAGFNTLKDAQKVKKHFSCRHCQKVKTKIPIVQAKKNKKDTVDNRKSSPKLKEMHDDFASITPKNCLNDTHIAYMMKNVQKELGTDPRLLFIEPSVAHWLKCSNKEETQVALDTMQADQKENIFIPICKRADDDKEGGEHWSLMLYNRDNNTWFHMDPIKGYNSAVAQNLINNINFYVFKGKRPKFIEVTCTQQDNNYDCGPFVGLFTRMAAKRITEGNSLNTCFVDKSGTRDIRKDIKSQLARDIIVLRDAKDKRTMEKNNADDLGKEDKKVLGDTRNNVKPKDKLKIKPRVNTQRQKVDEVCKYWTANKCQNGENCKYAHPIMCGETLSVGYCSTESCSHYHPQVCRTNMNHKECRWGVRCRFRHIYRNVTSNSYSQNYRYVGNYGNSKNYSERQRNHTDSSERYGRSRNNYPKRNNDQHSRGHRDQGNREIEDFLWNRMNQWEKNQLREILNQKMVKKWPWN